MYWEVQTLFNQSIKSGGGVKMECRFVNFQKRKSRHRLFPFPLKTGCIRLNMTQQRVAMLKSSYRGATGEQSAKMHVNELGNVSTPILQSIWVLFVVKHDICRVHKEGKRSGNGVLFKFWRQCCCFLYVDSYLHNVFHPPLVQYECVLHCVARALLCVSSPAPAGHNLRIA